MRCNPLPIQGISGQWLCSGSTCSLLLKQDYDGARMVFNECGPIFSLALPIGGHVGPGHLSLQLSPHLMKFNYLLPVTCPAAEAYIRNQTMIEKIIHSVNETK